MIPVRLQILVRAYEADTLVDHPEVACPNRVRWNWLNCLVGRPHPERAA